MILASNQENDRAIIIFTRAQTLRPEHSWPYIGLGVAYNNKQDYRRAVEALEKAVELAPDSINAQFQLGQASFHLGDTDRALSCLERVIALDPKFNPMAYKFLSSLYVKKQDPQGAARSLEGYLANFPDASDRSKVEEILKKLKP